MPQSFFFVEVGPPNNSFSAFVGRFNNYVCVFSDFLVPITLPEKDWKIWCPIEFKFVDIVATFLVEKNLRMRTDPLGETI